jgi:hypothetical protein
MQRRQQQQLGMATHLRRLVMGATHHRMVAMAMVTGMAMGTRHASEAWRAAPCRVPVHSMLPAVGASRVLLGCCC